MVVERINYFCFTYVARIEFETKNNYITSIKQSKSVYRFNEELLA